MDILFIDDSVPFDGRTPALMPLGSAQRAFAHLPAHLAKRGHNVRVINRAEKPGTHDGVEWLGWEAPHPDRVEVLVAFRRVPLLEWVEAEHKVLWLADHAGYLDAPARQAVLERTQPWLVFQGEVHRHTWSEKPEGLAGRVIPPGIAAAFREAPAPAPDDPPRAVVTGHPAHDLDWLLRVWVDHIAPAVPEAQIHLHSMLLDHGVMGGEVPPAFRPILSQALDAQEHGAFLTNPLGESGMSEVYRGARVHLHAGRIEEMLPLTLLDSRACGVPTVARPFGQAGEWITDIADGFLVPDEITFAQRTIKLLTDDEMWRRMSARCREAHVAQSWDIAASEFEEMWY